MAKSKEQKREEARQRQKAHGWQRVNIPLDIPFLCGGYTQTDWDLLIRAHTDWEDYDHRWEVCDSIEEQYDFLAAWRLHTKPFWA